MFRHDQIKFTSFLVIAVVIILGATVFRVAALDLKPCHHDESVNFFILKKLVEKHTYFYDPMAFHGPFLYYIGLPCYWLLGTGLTALRLTPAIFGVLCVVIVLLMHRWLGRPRTLWMGALLAVAPVEVYFARTFIHEIYLVVFTLTFLAGLLAYFRKPNVPSIYICFISLALCFTIKETAILTLFSLAAAYAGTRCWRWLGKSPANHPEDEARISWSFLLVNRKHLERAFALSVIVWALFFSSFLTYPYGLRCFFTSFDLWRQAGLGNSTGHAKPFGYFALIISRLYLPVVIPALLAGIWAVIRKRELDFFLFLYALSSFLLYSLIPYKTPWCAIQFGLPLLLLAGSGFTLATRAFPKRRILQAVVKSGLILAMGWLIYLSIAVNFFGYDVIWYKIPYAQTLRENSRLFQSLELLLRKSSSTGNIEAALIQAYHPVFYYLRDCKNAYVVLLDKHKEINQPLIITQPQVIANLRPKLSKPYVYLKARLWPGGEMSLLVSRELYLSYPDCFQDPALEKAGDFPPGE